jgi:A/G-specific adenine glycosylase
MSKTFSETLLIWSASHLRPMPWKGIKNPYFIWLSEIILQQTRVEQGLPYYLKFKENYPTIKDLADAPEDEIMKCWEGLGYYSRARNLHAAAKYITYDCGGIFPNTYDNLLKIKGVGTYTASAIASFAFDLPHAVIDGNVYRVLARIFGIDTPIDMPEGQKEFRLLADELLDCSQPALYNQAIMDFGATQCTPKLPLCNTCNFNISCVAFLENKINILPVKSKKILKKNRFFNYFIFKNQEKTFIRKRIEKDIWQDLYEFPMIESEQLWSIENVLENNDFYKNIEKKHIKTSKPFKHVLTHQNLYAQFFEIEINDDFIVQNKDWIVVFEKDLKFFAFPRLIDLFISEKSVSLTLF